MLHPHYLPHRSVLCKETGRKKLFVTVRLEKNRQGRREPKEFKEKGWSWQVDLQSPLCEFKERGKEEDLQERRKVLTIFSKIQLRPKTVGEWKHL